MIVKIWPIKADYAGDPSKVGGTEGLKNAYEYITNPEKVIVGRDDEKNVEVSDENSSRVLKYMANEDKVKGKYISGYMCDPERAVQQFQYARDMTLKKLKKDLKEETGAVAFHMIQSFPEGLDISDEEVHQCGIELCEKINAHQAVICSHVHPEKDEDGELHGKSKHNHILLNAYIYPEKLDPNHPDKAKYHDCEETYAQLRVWNDEIAINHGLPIIRNPDDDRVYSWTEKELANKGLSWKQRVRLDIEEARKACSNWEQFLKYMNDMGYQIKDGADVTYITPGGEHRSRSKKLGRHYSKHNLELYWDYRNFNLKGLEVEVQDNATPPLLDTVLAAKRPLSVAVPIGMKKVGQKDYFLPLEYATQASDVLATYFEENVLYEICDENHRVVRAAKGKEILDCMELLRKGKEQVRQEYEPQPEPTYDTNVNQQYNPKRYYSNKKFINSQTRKPYRCSTYDQTGRRRSVMEMIFLLAVVVIKQEDGLWDAQDIPEDKQNEPIFAARDWKIQGMLDSIYMAQEEDIDTPEQLDLRLNDVGASISRARSALRKTTRAKEKMETLNEAVTTYRETAVIAHRVFDLPDGDEKEMATNEYQDVIEKYTAAKAVMYQFKVSTEDEVRDFEERYEKVQADLTELEDRVGTLNNEYRRLKKLKYNMDLAQNAQYCYGPNYSQDRTYQQEQTQKTKGKTPGRDSRSVDNLVQKSQPGKAPIDKDAKEREDENEKQ